MYNKIRMIVEGVVNKFLTENTMTMLYHKSPISCRESILKNGLQPSVGDSYKAHVDDREDLTPYIFLYDHNTINNGEYDSTYDDDIYAIDVTQLDMEHLFHDPDEYMNGCYVYDLVIPPSAIKLVYEGSEGDSTMELISKHSHIYA